MTKALFRLSLVALLILPFAVNAATGLTIQPIKVSQTLDKGAQVSGFILLSNASANDVRVELKVEFQRLAKKPFNLLDELRVLLQSAIGSRLIMVKRHFCLRKGSSVKFLIQLLRLLMQSPAVTLALCSSKPLI
jgi:hypothetical protein